MPLFWLAVAAERRKLAWQQRRLARPMASDGTA